MEVTPMKLAIPILLNCALVLGLYLAEKHTPAKRLPYIAKQIIIGILFGCVAAFASGYGVEWSGTTVNVRDAAPLCAGLVFGAPAGIISGLIGDIYRWFSVYWGGGTYTRLACSAATVLAGFMSAGLRKLMFDDKKPTWSYGICIAVVCEVLHMVLIFLTNMDNASRAFEFVKGATVPMMLGNSIAVGLSIILVSLVSHEHFFRKKTSEDITNIFQRRLLSCIVIAYLITSTFTLLLQNGMAQVETQEVFTVAINDVETSVREKSDHQLLEIAEKVRREYESDPSVSLYYLRHKYQIKEINVVDENDIIINSTEDEFIGTFDMKSREQSNEFVEMLKTQDSYVQDYSPRGSDGSVWRKYAALKLSERGFIQVGYDAEQFHQMLNEFVIDVTKNRHVGTSGFVAVLDESLSLVIDNDYAGTHISAIGIDPPAEMKSGQAASTLYYADITDGSSEESTEYMYVFKFVEGYCLVAAMPVNEAMFMRDASMLTSVFMQVLIFATLFIFIYLLIKRVIINNLKKINSTLAQITNGDLSVTVDVRSNTEFASLSDDINSTVATLKRYIAEAAARIDKELEYAKQIQLSALPANFPDDEDYSIYAQMIAAKEVGGDFYDFYKLSDTSVAFLVADVSGKGIPAAMFMMTAKTVIKDLAERGLSVNEIFTRANEKLCENNESGMFVTAWMGILDLKTGRMQFANAGHNPPLLKHADGSFEYLKTRAGFVLAGMEGFQYRINEITLNPGERIFLYTDGVPEATNADNMLYGEDRLLSFMNANASMEARELLPALKSDIDAFVGEAPQFDDITMLMVDYHPQKGRPCMMEKTFPAKDEHLYEVLGFVEETLESFGCPVKTQMAVSVAIEEVFVNVSHYAYQNKTGDVTLHIEFDEDSRIITFRMKDNGIPFNPLEKPDPDITLSAEERDIGGLGIFITRRTMDSLSYSYENSENILTMTKKI